MTSSSSLPLARDWPRTAVGVAAGAVIGTLGGLMGLGGAEFRLPLLVGVLGLAVRAAVPVNLAVSAIVLLAALPARAWTVPFAAIAPHLPELLGMTAGAVVAAYAGAGLLKRCSDRWLGTLILVLLAVLGVVMIGDAFLGEGGPGLLPEGSAWRVPAAAACGVVIGLVSSLLGVAGGELIIPTFVLGFGVPVPLAGSMSMLVGLPTIAAGLLRHLGDPACPLRNALLWRDTAGPLAVGSVLGAAAGGLLLGLVPADLLKTGLGLILIWSAFRIFAHKAG